jgi:hypothetical protein
MSERLTTKERAAVEAAYPGGLVAYVQRLRGGHGPTFYEKVYDNDGKLGLGVCRCGDPYCPVAALLVHINELRYSYELKVQDLAQETRRTDALRAALFAAHDRLSGQDASEGAVSVNRDIRGALARIVNAWMSDTDTLDDVKDAINDAAILLSPTQETDPE